MAGKEKLLKKYDNNAKEAKFLLGGIGTGNVSIDTRGELKDWEIFNTQGKGNWFPATFFSIWYKEEGKNPDTRVVQARPTPPFSHDDRNTYTFGKIDGLPCLNSSELSAEYPFARVDFFDDSVPLDISLEAFTPFIPLNADDSGIPVTIFRYKVENRSKRDINVSLCSSMANPIGYARDKRFGNFDTDSRNINKFINNGLKGIYFSAEDLAEDDLRYGNIFMSTTNSEITTKTKWFEGGWFEGFQEFWDDYTLDGKLSDRVIGHSKPGHMSPSRYKVGSIAASENIKPGGQAVFEFILSWYFPNRPNDWEIDEHFDQEELKIVKNYYTTKFSSSIDVAEYTVKNMNRLEEGSRDFSRALHTSTLPDYVVDALSSNITVLRSPTCFRLEDGTFLGWEGSRDKRGFCVGTCTHVWNYAQTVAFLFPELERSARIVEFDLETEKDGKMNFRVVKPFGRERHSNPFWNDLPAAADGQPGTIIRLYREWKFSGDSDFLKKLWPKVKLAIDYCITKWDTDGDFVLDGRKHNTYDIEFYGPEPLANILYLGALKAVYLIAEYLKDDKARDKYKSIFNTARDRIDKMLWDKEYYIQKLDDIDEYPYQFGKGCLSDQLLGQFLSHIAGLGYILPEEHVKKAVGSVFKYNFKYDFLNRYGNGRAFALNDEKGLITCSWPYGGRPRFPFVYYGEVWTGIEYQVATHLIFEDYVSEGLKIVKAVRDRHDGIKRNPWDELENCHHYARSMASWGLLIALSGFRYDLVDGNISFDPRINADDFSCFFSTGKGWGIYKQKKDKETGEIKKDIEVLYGGLEGIKIEER